MRSPLKLERSSALIGMVAAGALVFTACGSDDNTASGGALGNTDLPYSPNAMAASATGAAKPTVADTQPATKPKAG